MTEPRYEDLLYEKDGRVVTITLNRPDVYNAFREKLSALMESVEEWKSTTLGVNFPPE